ncbi:hypothetical protein ScPMuIL_008415, partial [Solemya velum]
PTPEMYATAYGHYNNHLKNLTFNAWISYYLSKNRMRWDMAMKIRKANRHHAHRLMRVHLNEWKEWLKYRQGRQAMAFQMIQHIYHVAMGRIIFEAWHNHTLDAKRQREYFERLERGDKMDDEDLFGQGTGEARDSLSTLPRKIAIKILSYVDLADLARCASVCRSWKVITQAHILWSRLDFYRVRDSITDKVATKLLSKCRPYLIHLNLRGCKKITEPTFLTISECRNLQDLNLSDCSSLNDETFKTVAKGCKILLYLNLSYTDITDASLRIISKFCHNVQFLSLAFSRKFSDKGLLYLACGRNGRKLEYLDLSGCLQITPEGFKNLASGCHNLQTLILNEFSTLNDDYLLPITENCPKLNTVSFLGSPLLTDETFKRLANWKKMKKIKVEGNHRISDVGVKTIGKLCPNLEHVYMADCQRLTDVSLKALAGCKNMSIINFADCVRITDTGVRYIADGLCGPKIRELNLTNCIRVGDMAMVNIHKRCHSLAYLSVCFCEHISEAGVELLGQTHSLTSLDLSGCNCGDQGLSALGNNTRLRDVTLSECVAITDLGLQKFTQQCKDIERLDLSHCMQITDGAVKNLAFCCRMINVLNLSGCRLITDLGLQYLSGVCHHLTQLDISGCLLVSEKSMKYLRKGCKKLKVLIMLFCKGISKSSAQKMKRHVKKVQYSDNEVPAYFGYT